MTEGIAASSWIAGLNTVPTEGGDHSHKKMVQARPRGIPRERAPRVTKKELTIIGKMPNRPLLGIHFWPRMKALGPIFQIKGSPCSKIKKVIKARTAIEERATRRRMFSMTFSLISMIIFLKVSGWSPDPPLKAIPGLEDSRRILKKTVPLLSAHH